MNDALKNRFDFVYLFDIKDGNPNGDPDAGNLPRVDPETGHGLVTDVCLKRKIRNFVGLVKGEQPPYEIYVKEKAVLNKQHERAYATPDVAHADKSTKVEEAKNWMCRNFFDVRAFGAVMSTGTGEDRCSCGQVRGPVQFTFARSVDPVVSLEHAITRLAVTTEREAEQQRGDNRTMGRKYTLPYALFRAHGFVSPRLANQTGFDTDDLELLWEALKNMFDHDRSAARGLMAARKLFVFRHDSDLGNAPAHILFELVKVVRKEEKTPARDFSDYTISFDRTALPAGIQLLEML